MPNEMSEKESRGDRQRDQEIVRRVLDGDPDAFSEVYRAYFHRIYAFTLKRVRDPIEAEDLTQETFVQLYRSLGSYEGRSSLLTWTFGIAQNVCYRYFRHCSRWMVGRTNDAVKVSLRRSRAALADGVPELNVVLENVAQSA